MRRRKVMRWVVVVVAVMIAISLILGACAKPAPPPPAPAPPSPAPAPTPAPPPKPPMEPVTLRMNATVFRPDSSYGKGMQWFCDEVTKRTDGLVKFDIIPPFALTKPGEGIDAINTGLCDAAFLVAVYYPTRLFLTNFDHCVFAGSSDYEKANIWAEPFIHDEAWMIHKELEREGMKMLFAPINSPFELMSKARISNLEDLQGLKIAVSGHYAEAQIRASGAVALTPTMVDRGTMLQTGGLEGSIIPRDQSVSFHLHEYTNHTLPLLLWGCWYATFGVINVELFNSFPEDVQRVLVDVGRETTTYLWELSKDDQARLAKVMEEAGHTILPPLPEADRLRWLDLGGKPMRDWLNEADERGVRAEGEELMEGFISAQEKIGYVWPDHVKNQLK